MVALSVHFTDTLIILVRACQDYRILTPFRVLRVRILCTIYHPAKTFHHGFTHAVILRYDFNWALVLKEVGDSRHSTREACQTLAAALD